MKRTHPTVINYRKVLESPIRVEVVRPNMAIELPTRSPNDQPGQQQILSKLSEIRYRAADEPISSSPTNITYTITKLPSLTSREPAKVDPAGARIEAQLKEVVTKLDEIAKAVEALKKSATK
jgi:hypothetical protein